MEPFTLGLDLMHSRNVLIKNSTEVHFSLPRKLLILKFKTSQMLSCTYFSRQNKNRYMRLIVKALPCHDHWLPWSHNFKEHASFWLSRDLSFNDFPLVFFQVGGSRAQLAKGMSLHEFPAVGHLGSGGATSTAVLGINFNDTTQTANFDLIVR